MLALSRQAITSSSVACLCLFAVSLLQFSRMQQLLSDKQTNTVEALQREISAEVVRLTFLKKIPTFGYDNLIANWIYLNFLQYFGDDEIRSKTGYGLSPQLIEEKPSSNVEKSRPQSTDLRNLEDSQGSNNINVSQNTKERLYTVACIDDSLTILKSIERFLDEDKFSVVKINDPVKALMQILRSKPDLILLDVEMPNLDGYELCSLLRRHSAFKNIPIVMVTGRTGFIDRAKAKMVRASGYLTKPFTQSELLKVVFKHIS